MVMKIVIDLPEEVIDILADREWFDALIRLRNQLIVNGMTEKQMQRQQSAKAGLLGLVKEFEMMENDYASDR
jgi:hypothetical protein